jgi:hypothetical protein
VSLFKKVAFYAVLAAVVAAALEVVSSAFLYLAHRSEIASLAGRPPGAATLAALGEMRDWLFPQPYTHMARIPQDFFAEDAEQGYRANPGRYVFRYFRRRGDTLDHLDTVVTINADGTRFTGPAPAAAAKRIFVLGDSFVFGDGVNDEQTFSFLLQAGLPRAEVHLLALGGYSWPNALVTLRRIADRIRPGDAVVLGYAWYYKERHVAAPARLRSIRDWMATSFPQTEPNPKDRLARARLDAAGALVLDTIPMHCKFAPANCSAAEPTPEETDKVSIALLHAIAERSRAKIYLLHFFGPRDDPVLKELPGTVELIEATPEDFPYVMRDDIMGFDEHGGPYWHYAMYSRLLPLLAGD